MDGRMNSAGLDAVTNPRLLRSPRGVLGRFTASNWSFILPGLLVLVCLVVFPTIYTLVISLTRWDLAEATPRIFVGLTNYAFLLGESRFWLALGRTVAFTGTSTLLTLVAGMSLAVMMNRPLPAKSFFRTILIVPMILTPVVVGLTWRFLYNPELGLINYLISLLGLEKIAFLGQVNTALPAVILTDVWQYAPFAFLILLSGLESLPVEPFEAAQIDGASPWQIFWAITLPLMRGPIIVAILFRVMFSFNTFDTIYVMTGGGPGRATETLTMYAYRLGFQEWRMGESAAAALFMLVLITVVTRVILNILKSSDSELLEGELS